jgi:hypothetical protein
MKKWPTCSGDRQGCLAHPRNNSKDDHSWKPSGGVRHVKANPVIGNVLILYEPDTISQDQIGGSW